MSRRYWDNDGLDYEPAPIEFSAGQALTVLARLYHRSDLQPLHAIDDGICDDCRHEGRRYTYGRTKVCLSCGLKRRKAAQAA